MTYRPTITERFDPRANALNAVRLALALLVIVWHAFPLAGETIAWEPLRQFLGETAVDGFFAVSGFLIVGSWIRNPQWGRFLLARVLRIFPAFWVCLVVTAFVIAPIATMVVTGLTYAGTLSPDNVGYVFKNAALRIFQPRIDGTPVGVPFTDAWNGSLWTLWWEFLCYLGVLALGVFGLLRRRWLILALFLAATLALIPTAYGPVDNFLAESAVRFGVMFLAGAVLRVYADRIPLTWPLIAIAGGVTLGTMFLPDYRILGALPLGYAIFGIGALITTPRLRFEQDLSYGTYIYAFPVQQLLASFRVYEWGIPAYIALSTAITLVLAAASWFLIERNAMKLKPRRRNDQNVQTIAVADPVT
ncbi:acyltransferase [Microbacterium sp. CCNWLW134]|uniref:acyltransferase family protein n=1 Tax=Microbacterium sp. CCNWLW134 TaxID=3122064 RepID=UPI003010069A